MVEAGYEKGKLDPDFLYLNWRCPYCGTVVRQPFGTIVKKGRIEDASENLETMLSM